MADTNTCDDCGIEMAVAHSPEGRDGPTVCIDCAQDYGGATPEAVRDGRRYANGEPKPLTEARAHRQARQRRRVIENAINSGGRI